MLKISDTITVKQQMPLNRGSQYWICDAFFWEMDQRTEVCQRQRVLIRMKAKTMKCSNQLENKEQTTQHRNKTHSCCDHTQEGQFHDEECFGISNSLDED